MPHSRGLCDETSSTCVFELMAPAGTPKRGPMTQLGRTVTITARLPSSSVADHSFHHQVLAHHLAHSGPGIKNWIFCARPVKIYQLPTIWLLSSNQSAKIGVYEIRCLARGTIMHICCWLCKVWSRWIRHEPPPPRRLHGLRRKQISVQAPLQLLGSAPLLL